MCVMSSKWTELVIWSLRSILTLAKILPYLPCISHLAKVLMPKSGELFSLLLAKSYSPLVGFKSLIAQHIKCKEKKIKGK